MDLSINVSVNFTGPQFASAAGLTLPAGGADWEFLASSTPPTGLTLTFMKLSGTPTALGSWTVQINAVDDGYNFLQGFQVPLNVIDPNAPVDPPVEEPEPEPTPDTPGARVAKFLDQPEDIALVALADQHAFIITAMVRAYTRGKGFTEQGPAEDLAAVITTATARLVTNPEQLDITVGGTRIGKGFQGWTLAETFVLNNYRRRAG